MFEINPRYEGERTAERDDDAFEDPWRWKAGKLPATLRLKPPATYRQFHVQVDDAQSAERFSRLLRDADGSSVAGDAEHAVQRAASSGGDPLPDDVRLKFESCLDTDLSGVRVHTGDASAQAASAVGARAYAVGQDIHFAAGQYDPSSARGQHLLAHEVAHTVQQSDGAARDRQHKLEVSEPGDALEIEADRAADAMVGGEQAWIAHGGGGIARKIMRTVGGDPGGALSYKFAGDKSLGKFSAGPFKFEGKLKYEANAKVASGPAPAKDGDKPASPKTKIETGGKSGPGGETGWQSEVKHEMDNVVLGGIEVTPELKAGAEISTKGGKFGLGVGLSTKAGPVKLSFKGEFSILKWKAGEDIKVMVGAITAEGALPLYEKVLTDGKKVSIETKLGLTLEVTPDYARIAQWLIETLGAEAATSVAALAVPAAAAAAIAAGLYFAKQEGDDIGQISYNACKELQSYAEAYVAALATGAGGAGSAAGAQGAAAGAAALAGLKDRFPEAIVAEKVKEQAIYGKIVAAAKPQFRAEAERIFKEKHPLKVALFGVPSSFYDNLDTRLGHVGDKRDEASVDLR